jgi:hypothetical protein
MSDNNSQNGEEDSLPINKIVDADPGAGAGIPTEIDNKQSGTIDSEQPKKNTYTVTVEQNQSGGKAKKSTRKSKKAKKTRKSKKTKRHSRKSL